MGMGMFAEINESSVIVFKSAVASVALYGAYLAIGILLEKANTMQHLTDFIFGGSDQQVLGNDAAILEDGY